MKKVPYMLIVGEKEFNDNTVSVRKHGGGDLGTFTLSDFSKMIQDEIDNILNVK